MAVVALGMNTWVVTENGPKKIGAAPFRAEAMSAVSSMRLVQKIIKGMWCMKSPEV